MHKFDLERYVNAPVPTALQATRGKKFFELSNHLGNVLTTITDQKLWRTEGGNSYYVSTVKSVSDYYPFGLSIAGRNKSENEYRFGFNGKENDDSWGDGLIQDYGFRIYSPSICRFPTVDPLTSKYPELTPYQFASNTPIMAIDLDGLESSPSTTEKNTSDKSYSRGMWDKGVEIVGDMVKSTLDLPKTVEKVLINTLNVATDKKTYLNPTDTYLKGVDSYLNFMTSYTGGIVNDANLMASGNRYEQGRGFIGLMATSTDMVGLGLGLTELSFSRFWGLNRDFSIGYKPRITEKSFFTVQGPEDARRLLTGKGVWPTAANRAQFGAGVYAWDNSASALAYRTKLEATGVTNLSILEFKIHNETLSKLRTMDLTKLSDFNQNSWLNRYSSLYGGTTNHGFQHIIRTTGMEAANEYYFRFSIYNKLNFVKK